MPIKTRFNTAEHQLKRTLLYGKIEIFRSAMMCKSNDTPLSAMLVGACHAGLRFDSFKLASRQTETTILIQDCHDYAHRSIFRAESTASNIRVKIN